MSAFEIYVGKIRSILKDHFDGNESPPVVERMLSDEKVKNLYTKSYHPRRVTEIILHEAQEQADEKYRLALRDNPDLTKEQWAKDFTEAFLLPKGGRLNDELDT